MKKNKLGKPFKNRMTRKIAMKNENRWGKTKDLRNELAADCCPLLCFYSAASTSSMFGAKCGGRREEVGGGVGGEVAQHVACHMPTVFGQLQSPFPRSRFGPSEQARERGKRGRWRE